jgi:hypothetical protein
MQLSQSIAPGLRGSFSSFVPSANGNINHQSMDINDQMQNMNLAHSFGQPQIQGGPALPMQRAAGFP